MIPLGQANFWIAIYRNSLHDSIGISHLKDNSAPLDATNSNNKEGEGVEECVSLSALVHPESIIQVESLLLLLDQLVLGRDVVTKRILASVAAQVLSSCSCRCRERPACHQSALASK